MHVFEGGGISVGGATTVPKLCLLAFQACIEDMVDATRMNHHGLGQPATGCSMTTPCCRLNESAPRNATPWTNLTLPRFHSLEELRQQPQWHGYLNAVFGAESEYTFPVDLDRNTFFYFNALPSEWQRALVARPLMATDATVDSRTGKVASSCAIHTIA
mgnify:FL=1